MIVLYSELNRIKTLMLLLLLAYRPQAFTPSIPQLQSSAAYLGISSAGPSGSSPLGPSMPLNSLSLPPYVPTLPSNRLDPSQPTSYIGNQPPDLLPYPFSALPTAHSAPLAMLNQGLPGRAGPSSNRAPAGDESISMSFGGDAGGDQQSHDDRSSEDSDPAALVEDALLGELFFHQDDNKAVVSPCLCCPPLTVFTSTNSCYFAVSFVSMKPTFRL